MIFFSEMFYAFMHLFLCILALQTDISSRSSLKRISAADPSDHAQRSFLWTCQLHIAFPFAWQIPLPALSDACDSTGDHLYSFGNTDPVSADPYDQRKTGWNRKKERGRFCLNR